MRLQLYREFRGRLTNERPIPPGVYDEEDPRLFGLADYLIQHTFAQWVDDPAVVVADAIQMETGVEMVDFPVDVAPTVKEDAPPVEPQKGRGKGRK